MTVSGSAILSTGWRAGSSWNPDATLLHLLKGAVYIHPTLAEVFFALMEDVKPVD
jgi:hypothetical protein